VSEGMHTSVRQISISGSSYFLRLDWSGPDLGSGFQLLLTDTEDAWKGEVTQKDLCEEAKELEMENERYLQDLHQALSGTECSTAYSFSLINSGASFSLAFEKVQKDISFRLGSVALTALSNPAEAVRDLLIYSMAKGNSLERQNNKVEQQNQRLRNEHQRITAQLKQYSKDKTALESELYSRFVLVLNQKKDKIRSLLQTLNDLQDKLYVSPQSFPHFGRVTENADEYEGSTEDETEASEPKPVTRKRTSPSPLDDSLSDLTDVAPCRKRRVRHLEAPAWQSQKPHTYKKRRYYL
uniref:X-ray repair complementing defective repair in Chinese hamster cells 4 n=1 Tax=Neogobius melanostomus TaxID=47308 RepID=A0A8C6TCA3_9GOBI